MALTAKYTEQVVAMVEPTMKARLQEVADDDGVSLAQTVREAIEEGLPALRARKATKR